MFKNFKNTLRSKKWMRDINKMARQDYANNPKIHDEITHTIHEYIVSVGGFSRDANIDDYAFYADELAVEFFKRRRTRKPLCNGIVLTDEKPYTREDLRQFIKVVMASAIIHSLNAWSVDLDDNGPCKGCDSTFSYVHWPNYAD